MNEEEIFEKLEKAMEGKSSYKDIIIENQQKKIDNLKEQNNDLRKIYRNTYKKLFDNGNNELARYFQAQIDECPTFYVEPIIDYYKEYNKQKEVLDKAKEYIKENIADTDFMEENYDFDLLDEYEIEVEYEDIKKLLELLEEIE